jgi:hypothetical protein
MKTVLKSVLPLIVAAAPAAAHSGAHMHPHGYENLFAGLAFIAVVAVAVRLAFVKRDGGK